MHVRMEKGPKQYKIYLIQNHLIQLVVEGCLAGIILYGMHFFNLAEKWTYLICGLLVIDVLVHLIRPYMVYYFYTYRVVDGTIEIQRRYWFQQYEAVKIERIQFLKTHTNPLSKYHHLTQIKVVTAGHEITLPYLNQTQTAKVESYCMARLERGEADV